MAATFWNIDQKQASEMLRKFRRRSLLQKHFKWTDQRQQFRMHDLLHDMAVRALVNAPLTSLDDNIERYEAELVKNQSELLERYKSRADRGLWYKLPNDGYIYQHLTWHMEKAGQADEVHNLLQLEIKDSKNAWYIRCNQIGQPEAFIADVNRAWNLAVASAKNQSPSVEERGKVIGLQCQYMLMLSSINSLSRLPENLVISLVNKEIWHPEQGITYARQTVDPSRRYHLLSTFSDYLPQQRHSLLQEALAAVQQIEEPGECAKALRSLLEKLPKSLLPNAFSASQKIGSPSIRVYVLVAIGDKLPEALSEALQATCEIGVILTRIRALITLGVKAPEALPEAIRLMPRIDMRERSLVLQELLQQVPEELLPDVLTATLQIKDLKVRTQILTALGKSLPKALPKALIASGQVKPYWMPWEAGVIRDLYSRLPRECLLEALQISRQTQFNFVGVCAVTALGKNFSEVLPEALSRVLRCKDGLVRSESLIELAKVLPEKMPEALTNIQQIQERYTHAKVLVEFAENFPETLSDTLTIAQEIENERSRAEVLRILGEKVPQALMPTVLASAKKIQNATDCLEVLVSLAKRSPDLWLSDVLSTTLQIKNESLRIAQLDSLWRQLPQALLPEACTAIKQLPRGVYILRALRGLMKNMPESMVAEALSIAQQIQSVTERAEALIIIGDRFPEALHEALITAQQIQDHQTRTKVLTTLGKYFPEALHKALVAAKHIQDEKARAEELMALGEYLPEALSEALKLFQQIKDAKYQAKVLIALGERYPEALSEAIIAIRQIPSELDRSEKLYAFVQIAPESLLTDTLDIVQQTKRKQLRTLSVVRQKFPGVLPEETIISLLSETLVQRWNYTQHDSSRASILIELVELMEDFPEIEVSDLLDIIQQFQCELSRAKVMIALEQKYSALASETITSIRQIKNEKNRVEMLINIGERHPSLFSEALTILRESKELKNRVELLSTIGKKLPPFMAPEAINTAQKIREEFSPVLESSEAVKAIDKRQNEWLRAALLEGVFERLPEEYLCEAVSATNQIQTIGYRAQLLIILGQRFPKLLPEALDAVRQIQNDCLLRANLLTKLGVKLPEVLPEALITALPIWQRPEALETLREKLPEVLPIELKTLLPTQRLPPHEARKLTDLAHPKSRAKTLINLVNKFPEAFPYACTAISKVPNHRSEVLHPLGKKIPNSLLPRALKEVQKTQDTQSRAWVFLGMGERIPESLLPRALEVVQKTQNSSYRAKMLSVIGERLPESLIPRAISIALQIQDEADRSEALSVLIKASGNLTYSQALQNYQLILRGVTSDSIFQKTTTEQKFLGLSSCYRPSALNALSVASEVAENLGGQSALRELTNSIVRVCRWWP